MLQKATGIVLHTTKYNDKSFIADVYTRERGRVSFIAPTPKSRHSTIKNSLFQPFSIINIDADFRTTRELNRIKQAQIVCSFTSIPFDQYKTTIVFFISEFLTYALREEQQNIRLFEYLKHSICWLDNCKTSYANFHIVFLIHLSSFLGFYPNFENYEPHDYFDLKESCYTKSKPVYDLYLDSEETEKIHNLTRINYNNMHLFKMNRVQRNRCIEIIIAYYQLHLPNFPKMKSLDVLRSCFDF